MNLLQSNIYSHNKVCRLLTGLRLPQLPPLLLASVYLCPLKNLEMTIIMEFSSRNEELLKHD